MRLLKSIDTFLTDHVGGLVARWFMGSFVGNLPGGHPISRRESATPVNTAGAAQHNCEHHDPIEPTWSQPWHPNYHRWESDVYFPTLDDKGHWH